VGEVIEKHQANARWYDEALADLKSVRPLRYKDDRLSSYWLYTVRAKDREQFTERMKAADIIVSQVHARNDDYSMFKDFKVSLPGLDEFTHEQVSIPVGWWLTEKEREHIVNAILKYDRIITGSKQPSNV